MTPSAAGAGLLGFNIVSAGVTLLGGLTLFLPGLLSRRSLWRLFSLRSGILLAVAFTQILPEALGLDASFAGWGALAAFVLLFCMESFLMLDCCPEYLEECSVHLLSLSALAALFLHALIDGFNLTVSYSAGALAGSLVGVALVLHKFADGFTLTTLMRQGGYPRRAVLAALILIALATPLGSLLSLWEIAGISPRLLAACLGFSAGSFIYIGAADILPRLHKHRDWASLAFFAAGLLLIAAARGGHG